MFGAGHFVFYNYSTGPLVRTFLDSYSREGLVTVVPWPLPVAVDVWPPVKDVDPAIHYFGQLAALNDCLYRCLGRSRLAVFTDLDEILVPRAHGDWISMLNNVSGGLHPAAAFPGEYLVRSSFFRTDWPSDDEGVPRPAVDLHLLTLTKTRRETTINPWSERSKYAVWTKAVQSVGVHDVLEMMPGAQTVLIDHPVALVHHYRTWIDTDFDANPPVVDRSMRRFTDEIVARVRSRNAVVDARNNA